jgi:hypothetical protein
MAGLAAALNDAPRPARLVMSKLEARRQTARPKETRDVIQSLLSARMRSVWVSLGAVAALAVALSFAPVRAWAGELLGLFRVERITILPVDVAGLSQLGDDERLVDQIGRLFSDSMTVTREPGELQEAASADDAGQQAGFEVRELSGATGPAKYFVQAGGAFEMVVDRSAAQAILDEAGRSDLQLPASLDGATISVDVPAGVSIAYGDCPEPGQGRDDFRDDPEALRFEGLDCTLLLQIPSPTVETPPDVNLAQLAEVGLQFTGMTPEEARAFSQTVDWTSTLVIPMPSNGTGYEQVQVDGVPGNLIYRQSESGNWNRYTVLWVKDGIVYALSAYGDKDEAVRLANSLQ